MSCQSTSSAIDACTAQRGEYLLFDTINGISPHQNASLVFLVDPLGCAALRSSIFEGSADGMTWVCSDVTNLLWLTNPTLQGSLGPSHLICDPEHQSISAETPKVSTQCSISLGHADIPGLRYLRATLVANVNLLWCLYEIWIDAGTAV